MTTSEITTELLTTRAVYVELLDDRVMFNLDDFIAISALEDVERVRSKADYQTRLTLRNNRGDLLLKTSYEQARNQIIMAVRAASEVGL